MKKLNLLSGFLLSLTLFVSCSSLPDNPWSDAIPEDVPFVIIPDKNATLTSVLNSSYSPFLDDITSSAVQLLSRVDSTASDPIYLKGIALYPGTSNQLEIVWIAESSNRFIDQIGSRFKRPFTQNYYEFLDQRVSILHTGERNLFATQLNDLILLSESSLALEDAIRSYVGNLPRANLSSLSLKPGHIVMNTPKLDRWFQQLALVIHRPEIQNSLQGTNPALLSLTSTEGEKEGTTEYTVSGDITFTDDVLSNLVSAFSTSNSPVYLDRFISSNAAAFAIFRQEPRLAPSATLPDTSRLDSLFLEDATIYGAIAQTFDHEFAITMYAESGFLSTGEHLFLRKVDDVSKLRRELRKLAREGKIERTGKTYYVQSSALAKLIGGDISGFSNFYLDITRDVAIISQRKGLVELVSTDRNRRRTMYYEQDFRKIKQELPDNVSSLLVTTPEFSSFIEPFLAPGNYLSAFTSKFDVLTAYTTLDEQENKLSFNLKTYQTQDRSAPYRERWQFPTGSELSGEPILEDIGGSYHDEVIFATKSGYVYGLAFDGSVMFEANTGGEEPIGSPVIYDWYGTNEKVILLATERKIYGWNDNGQMLPRFPFEMDESITTPLVINDIDRDGLPNAIVATADRKLHVLNGRGQNISGWPVTTNAEITTKPTVEDYRGELSVLAFSENAIHVWDTGGDPREDFPQFLNASLNGSPTIYEDHILGNASDGYLYSVGPTRAFDDTLNVLENSEASALNAEAIYVSDSPLLGTPSIQNLTIADGENVYNEPMILTMSANGSVFLLNTSGNLRFSQNMGQPAATSFSPYIEDINSDTKNELISLGSFGRLYIWDINSQERIYSMPTAGMKYPIVADLNNDGYKELIAYTQNGVRSWTIFNQEEDNDDNSEGDNEDE